MATIQDRVPSIQDHAVVTVEFLDGRRQQMRTINALHYFRTMHACRILDRRGKEVLKERVLVDEPLPEMPPVESSEPLEIQIEKWKTPEILDYAGQFGEEAVEKIKAQRYLADKRQALIEMIAGRI